MKNTYVIGEIGQNHNGSLDIAKLIVDIAARPVTDHLFGCDLPKMNAVKLTKRDLNQELSKSQMDRPYNSPHSFGTTYGEHRAVLELSDDEHFEVYKHAKSQGLEFVETLCAIGAMSLLKIFEPDRLKVASRDLTNLPLLAALGETKIPIIVSTGMAGKEELDNALEVLSKYHSDISVLHCVSEYPTKPVNVNLRTIQFLKKTYPSYTIGYSDHTIGISAPVAAVAMGAQIIEKHITIDRKLKGTDQAGSLAIDGIQRMMRDIRNLEMSLGQEEIFICPGVAGAREKLERSIALKEDVARGTLLREEHLHMLSPGNGIKWVNRNLIVGKKANKDLVKNELIHEKDVS